MNRGERKKISLKKMVFVLVFTLLLSMILMVLTVPLHEGAHVIMSTLDPSLNVKEIYLFGVPEKDTQGHALPSYLGCVIVESAYPGALQERAQWADFGQEIVCISIQLLITCFVTYKSLIFLFPKISK